MIILTTQNDREMVPGARYIRFYPFKNSPTDPAHPFRGVAFLSEYNEVFPRNPVLFISPIYI